MAVCPFPPTSLGVFCCSNQCFGNDLLVQYRVMCILPSSLDKASAFGFLQRVDVQTDRSVLIDALERARTFEKDFSVSGFVIGDRHRNEGEEQSQEVT